jgi:serine/threonine protein kinase/tetratricopeptide (TPR) repeat protein
LHGDGFLASVEYLQNGRYALLKKLGEGGKGIVYKARDTVLNRVVAVKVLKSTVTSDEAYSRFMTEARAVAKLNHPNIVTIHDIGKEDGKQFFVLEFVDGESLRDLVQTYPEGKCDVQTVLRIGMDVCNALQYAHSEKVLHRDIKPENVMITKDGTAKLMDFGLAKMVGQPQVTQEGVIVGTVAYVAPEVALGKGADSRSDLYSFGAVLYEALSGKPPFQGDDPIKVIFGHIHDHPTPLSKLNLKIPQAIVDCVMRLLEKEPEKRYQSAVDLLKALRGISEEFLRETLLPAHKASVVVPSPRPIAAREIQLIDRVEEMGVLREAVDKTVHGEGGLVLLHGEAGIGKTRLTRELRAYARLRGMQVLYGRCPALFRMDGVPPYTIWSEVIKDYLENSSQEQLYRVIGFYPAEVVKLVPELSQRLRTIPQSLPISPEHKQNRLFEAVSQFIINISRESPLLVVLDDLQWTDPSSLLLLHYLARGVQKTSLLLLGAYRSTDIDAKHPMSPVLTELNRERLPQSIQLKRMSLNDVSEMIKNILEQDDVPADFCKLVYEKTKGNPFFAEEVVKSLKEEEVIRREENKWAFKDISGIEFPVTVKNVVKARFGRLDDERKNVLTLASFIGNDFTLEAMCAVTGIEESKLLELMDEMFRIGLIKERVIRGEVLCSFADMLVRDVVYEEVSPLKRKKLHGVVGCALEKVYAKKIDEHFGELAYHFLETGDKEKALDYFLKAGDKASKIYANAEAVSYLQHALSLLEDKEGELQEKASILERLGDVEKLIGKYDDCVKHWNEALSLWAKLQKKDKTATLHRKMANVFWDTIGDTEKAKEHHEAALKILEAEPESVELARLYEDVAHMLRRKGKTPEALIWAEKSLALAEKLNALEAVAIACCELTILSFMAANYKKGREYVERALKTALDNSYLETAWWAYYRAYDATHPEEYEKRLEYTEKGLVLAKKIGNIAAQASNLQRLALEYLSRGELARAITVGEEALALNKKAGNKPYIPWDLFALGEAYLRLGEWEKSEQLLTEAMDKTRGTDELLSALWGHHLCGKLHFDKEEYTKAKKWFEEGVDIGSKAGSRTEDTPLYSSLVLTYIELGEIEKAQNLLDGLRKLALETGEKWLINKEMVLRAGLLRAQKKWDESIELFEKALKESGSIKADIWNVYFFARWVLCEYARACLERNGEGDREKAHSLLNQAMEMFQKVGAKKEIEKIIAKKKLLTS